MSLVAATTFVPSLLLSFVIVFSSTTMSQHIPSVNEITEYFDYNTTFHGEETCSLISIVMDESSSMAGAQDFMRNIAVPEMMGLLKTVGGIDNVFVCSHGYGTPDHNPWGLQMGHYHGCSEATATGLLDTSIMDSWTSHGDIEDGWQAIHYAIRDIPSSINGKNLSNTCKTLGKSMILVTDEDRDNNTCNGHVFHLEMKTDRFGTETSWKLENSTGHVVFEDGMFPNNAIVKATTCLEDDGIHTLTFYDSYNDGFCCDNGDGYFKVWYDDDLVIDSSAEFESQISVQVPSNVTIEHLSTTMRASTEHFTKENTIEKLLETGYSFDVITETTFHGLSFALGVSAESILFQPDDYGSFFENKDFVHKNPIDLLNDNPMVNDYAPIAFATGGATWGLGFVKVGGSLAQSFAKAFTEMKAKKIKDETFLTTSPTSAPPESSLIPTFEPTQASVYSGRIGPSSPGNRRIAIGLVTGGLLTAVALAFFASRGRKREDGEDEDEGLPFKCETSDKGSFTTDEEDESIDSSEYPPSSSARSSFSELSYYEDDISIDFTIPTGNEKFTDHLVDLGDYDNDLFGFQF